jgi:PAS domain S-box-containing protein
MPDSARGTVSRGRALPVSACKQKSAVKAYFGAPRMRTRKRVGPGIKKQKASTFSISQNQLAATRVRLKRLAADWQTLAAIVDSSRDALWSWNSNGRIVRWNTEAERLFGYKADEIIGQSLLTLVPSDRHDRAREVIAKALQGQWYGQYETVRVRKDGTKIDVELTVSPITNNRGKVIGCLSSCRDISERKEFQSSLTNRMRELTTLTHFTERLQAARQIEEVYEAALDAIRDALGCDRASVLLYDSNKVMRFVAWRELSEQYRESVDGHSPWTADVQSPEPIFVQDIDSADQPKSLKATIKAEGIRALSFIPLIVEDKLIGKFMTYYREPHRFSVEEATLANGIARQLAIGIDRHRAQKELQESEHRFRLMAESAPVMIWVSGADGRCQHLNAMLRAFWGVSEDEITEFDWQNTIHPSDVDEIGTKMLAALSGRRSVTVKGRYSNASGQFRLLETHAQPRFSSTGEFLGMIGVNADITEQQSAQTRIAADLDAMTRLQQLGSLCAREGHHLRKCLSAVVAAATAITGAPRGSLQLVDPRSGVLTIAAQKGFTNRFLEFFAEVREDAPVTAAAAMRMRQRVVVEDVTRSEIFYDQTSIRVLIEAGVRAVQSTPLIGIDGKVFGVLTTHFSEPHRPEDRELRFIDLLARQTADYLNRIYAEEALRKLQSSLKAQVESRTRERDRIWNVSEDLLGVSNFEGHFLSVNPAWERTLGWTEEEIKALHVDQLRHPDDAVHSWAKHRELERGVPTVRMENRFRHKDGSWRWIAWTLTVDKGLIYLAGRHVTSEKESAAALERAHQQLANAQKMEALGQLTGGVAHDFNNIMMIVSGYAQYLKGDQKDPKRARALQAIQTAISRGENLTRQLLSFSRHQPLHPVVLHPSDAVEGIRDVLVGSTNGSIRLSVYIPHDTWPVFVDKSEFALALVNIAINARDAMPNGGEIIISAGNQQLSSSNSSHELTGDFVVLKITDTGCGIPASVIPKVFDPFFTTKEVDKGTGLGLSQVYGFASRSSGKVHIESELQRGTTVTLFLPRSPEPVPSPLSEPRAVRERRSGTVLVVEDNRDVRGVATSLLQQLGFSTLEVDSAGAALERLSSGAEIDLVFSDIVLPGAMDGLALAAELESRYPHIPVLLTTGYVRRLSAEPRYSVLRKPYDIAELDDAVNQAIFDNRRVGDELSGNSR